MSSTTTAPSPALPLSRGSSIEYKAYARRFQPNVNASVLILFATCFCGTSGFTISFQPTASGYELLEQAPAGIVRDLVTYYVGSYTTGIEADAPPRT